MVVARFSSLLLALLLAGSARAAPERLSSLTPAASTTTPRSEQLEVRPATPGAPGVVDQPLEDPSGRAMRRFFSRLRRLEAGASLTVRVSHWGDSHIAPDMLTGRVRTRLQQRFGDAGPGFVLLGQPWRSYRHDEAKLGANGRWRAERQWSRYSRRRRRPRDDLFGIAGISVHTRRSGRAWLAPRRGKLSEIDLYYLRQPRGGRIDVYADGKLVKRALAISSRKRAGFLHIELATPARRIELRARGGEVRLYGADLRTADRGVLYDPFGINGGTGERMLAWNEALMRRQLQRLEPDLVVVAFGSNELDADTLTRKGYAEAFGKLLRRLRRVSGRASCLVVGLPDQARHTKEAGWAQPPQIEWMIAEQRRLARRHGCAFFDQRAAMGGPGAIYRWALAQPPLARRDHVHLRGAGYRLMGDALYEALIRAYDANLTRRAERLKRRNPSLM